MGSAGVAVRMVTAVLDATGEQSKFDVDNTKHLEDATTSHVII